MLQFWKKSKGGSRDSVASCSKDFCENEKKVASVPPLSLFNSEVLQNDLNYERKKSRIPQTLQDLLSNKLALDYFIQYLHHKNASKYLMCWLDITSFKSSTKENCCNNVALPNGKSDSDSLSFNAESDSIATDLSSTSDCSTTNTDNSLDVKVTYDCGAKNGGQIVESSIGIFKKYIAQEAQDNINCPDTIRNQTIDRICSSEVVSSGKCFDDIVVYLLKILEEYFTAFTDSDYICKYMIDVMTSGDVVLGDILHNETALFYFMEYLQQENVCSLLEFWIAATHLQNDDQIPDPIEAQNDAVVLYDKYFSLQAHCPLGFSDKTRFEIEQNICGENGLVNDCFDIPLKIVEHVLETHYLTLFLKSELFFKYLSELINAVESNENMISVENHRNSSDCGSERSSHAFLALELNKNHTKRQADMTIDTRDLCDPDSLWKRKYSSHRLSCGRITALGKFETDLEPEPDERSFTIKRIMKNIVNLNEDKRKEEMAWQVAEMIVKDVTSVTLCQEKMDGLLL